MMIDNANLRQPARQFGRGLNKLRERLDILGKCIVTGAGQLRPMYRSLLIHGRIQIVT